MSNDYFHLLAQTATDDDDNTANGRDLSPDLDDDLNGGDTGVSVEEVDSSPPRSRTRHRPLRSSTSSTSLTGVEVAEEEDSSDGRQTPSQTTSRASRASRRRHTSSSSSSKKKKKNRKTDSTRRLRLSISSDDFTRGEESPSSSGRQSDRTDVEDDDDTTLKRSSFNSGYYARFFREERKLGSGGVGGVYLTHHVLDHVMLGTYAVKKIPVGNSRSWLLQVLKEVRALEGLHHRHIVAYKHSWLESYKPTDFGPEVPCLFLLMEYANHGTLANLIWPKPSTTNRRAVKPEPTVMSEEQIWSLFIGTLLGLRHLHRNMIIHRDVKPENLLLTSETDALGREIGLRVLVSDFGNAILKGVPYNRTGNTGTLAYSAPETLMPEREFAQRSGLANSSPTSSAASSPSELNRSLAIAYDEKCDLWSCGVVLYAMAFGKLPYFSNSPEALFAEIRNSPGGVLQFPSHPARSPDMLRMIRELLSIDPTQRPSLDDLLNRPCILRRREKRYGSSASVDNIAAGGGGNIGGGTPRMSAPSSVYSQRTETYRPPPGNALVISPMLTASRPDRARSLSPRPLLTESASASSIPNTSDGSTDGTITRPVKRRRSADHLSMSVVPTDSMQLVSRIALVDEDEPHMSGKLLFLRSTIGSIVKFVLRMLRRCTSYPPLAGTKCWQCQWNVSAEALVHLGAFLIKVRITFNASLPFGLSKSYHRTDSLVLYISCLAFFSLVVAKFERPPRFADLLCHVWPRFPTSLHHADTHVYGPSHARRCAVCIDGHGHWIIDE